MANTYTPDQIEVLDQLNKELDIEREANMEEFFSMYEKGHIEPEDF